MEYKSVLFYTFFLIFYLFLFYNMLKIFGIALKQILFLSHVVYFINLIYMIIQLLNSLKLTEVSRSVIDALFKFLFSLAMMADIMFWSMYLSDPKLFEKKGIVEPNWYKFCMHGLNLFFLFGEHFFIYKHYDSKKVGLPIIALFSGLYTVTLYCCFYFLNIEVYPFLEQFSLVQYVLLAIVSCLIMMVMTYTQKLFIEEEPQEPESINLNEDF